MEMAARRRGERRRDFASDRHKGAMLSVDPRNFLEQSLRVWMIRRSKQLLRRSNLCNTPKIHHDDTIRQMSDDA
jgi:NAD-dependent DNA ligase